METIDKPEEKRLFGIDRRINVYHLINPDKDELLIREVKSVSGNDIFVILFMGAVGLFFCYIAWNSYFNYREGSAALLPLAFGILPLVGTLLYIYRLITAKLSFHFTATDLVQVNGFGKKKIIPRSAIETVFITRTITETDRVASGFDFSVDLRLKAVKGKPHTHHLLSIKEKGSVTSALGYLNNATMSIAHQEATQIAAIISDHWKIPLSV